MMNTITTTTTAAITLATTIITATTITTGTIGIIRPAITSGIGVGIHTMIFITILITTILAITITPITEILTTRGILPLGMEFRFTTSHAPVRTFTLLTTTGITKIPTSPKAT